MRAVAAALLMLALAGAPCSAMGTAVEGRDRAWILPPAGAAVEPYENAGYRLRWADGVAQVEVDAGPLSDATPFRSPRQPAAGAEAVLARALTAGAATTYDAVSRILGWVASNISYSLDRTLAQEPSAVLARRTAYCTGVARLTVALLAAVEIPAREVAGYVVAEGPAGERSGFHRWVEVYYPGRGWVFSDPMVSHHFVSALYLRLASQQIVPELGAQGLLLGREERLVPADLHPRAPAGVRARRNYPIQVAAALAITAPRGATGEVVLEGHGERRTAALSGEGMTYFVGLEPGDYLLRLLLAGEVAAEKRLKFHGRVRVALQLSDRRRAVEGSGSR